MANTRIPTSLLAEKLIASKAILLKIMPDLKPIIESLENNNPEKLTKLAKIYQQQKKREFAVVELCSTEGDEKISIAEQIILYALTKRIALKDKAMNTQQKQLAITLMNEIGKYSFDWLQLQSRLMLKTINDNNATDTRSDEAMLNLTIINTHLAKFFWGAGHVKAALNSCELLNILAKNNTENCFKDAIEGCQLTSLEHITCARKLVDDEYSQSVMGMLATDQKIKNLFSDSPDKDQIPDDNNQAIDWLDNQIKSKLLEKSVDLSRTLNTAQHNVQQMKANFSKIQFSVFHNNKKNISAEEKSAVPNPSKN